MKKKNLTILNAGIAFIVSFILSQFTLILGSSITETLMSQFGRSASQIEAFWNTSVGYLLKSIYLNISFVIIFIWYFKSIDKNDLIKRPNKSTTKYVIICIVFGLVSFFLLSGLISHFEWFIKLLGYSDKSEPLVLNNIKDLLICYVSLAILPAVCEELLFRGVIINCLKHKGKVFAVVLSSIMFAVFHFSPVQLIYPICWGLILGIVYLRTQNILFPILMHFINNAFSLTIQYFTNTSGTFKPNMALVIYTIITFAIWIIAMIYMFKDFIRQNKKNSENSDSSEDNSKNISTNENQPVASNSNQKPDLNDSCVLYGSIIIILCIYILVMFA